MEQCFSISLFQLLYNGNISETFWRSSSDNIQRKYGYAYDYQNRLLAAYYQKPVTAVPLSNSYSTNYSYDHNGNILTLQRNGEKDLANTVIAIDDLLYTYDNGNKLKKVQDLEGHPAGFDIGNAVPSDAFEYDGYGNLTADPYKDITNITYNHLNLPIKITFLRGGKIEYFYDATGLKLKKKVTNGASITTTEYMDGFQYTNTNLDFFSHSEGYIKAVMYGNLGGTPSYEFRYVFNFTDHLGNIRLKYAQDPSNNNAVTILEEDHYYPYGLKHKGYSGNHLVFEGVEEPEGPGTGITLTPVNPFLGDSYKYKFGGMEYQEEFDINTYDFGARNYDPALGRWMNIDPLAEFMWSKSPYNYAFDNPIYYIDPDGMMNLPFGGGATGSFTSTNFGSSGGNGDIESGGSTEPDPQYPNTSGEQKIDEVVVVAKKKEKGVDGGVRFWGNDLEDRGHKIGTTQASIEINDFPIYSGANNTNRLMQLMRDFIDMLNWYNDVPERNKKPKATQSSMETRNEEPVNLPDPKEYYVRTYESWTDDGKSAGGTIGSKEKSKLRTLKEAKGDSSKLMRMKPLNRLRVRDSVTIQHVDI